MAGIVILIIVSAGAMIYSLFQYDLWSFGMPASGLMPVIGSAIVLCSCLWTAFTEKIHARLEISHSSLAYFAGFTALLPLSVLFGLLPALFVVAVALLRFVERLSFLKSVALSAAIGLGSWVVFQKFLGVPLPIGQVWSSLWMS
jgi:putative tricarboxylic transport membrane protein